MKFSSNTIACLVFAWGLAPVASVWAQRELTDIPVPDPAEELKTFVVADGFEVNLFAADPLIHKPIQFNFDPQGRLWVAASEVYPQIAPGQIANDKILILEDTNGDGVADKTTVFADGLLIPTGVVPGDGGAYVANSTELLHLSDTDGDGKADRSRIVLSGFGTEDTHHIIHTFRWGPESLFYMNQSIYIHSHVETPFGVRRLNAGGIWQFRPETLRLDILARGWINAWGHAFDRWGQSFVTDGAGGEGINYMVPGAAYPTAFGVSEILHGLNPGSPKFCGLAIVDGRHLPDDWQGSLITHDFRGHRVCRFIVEDEGAGYVSRQQPDLISSNHVAFRPIDVQQGPDGAIYIADWYNPIIQHGEVDFRDPRRDHVHGRIWRVTAKNRPLVPKIDLVNAPTDLLLEQLKSPESYTRQQAKRVLKERDQAEVIASLDRWVDRLVPTDAEFEHQRLEALWVYQGHDVVRADLLQAVLSGAEPHARAAAVRVVPHWADRLTHPEEYLAAAVKDDFPRVRLEAVRALATIPKVRSAELALSVIDRPMDGFLDYAMRQTIREMKPVWLPAVAAGTFQLEGQLSRLLYAVQVAEAAELVPSLVQRLEAGQIPDENRARVMEIIGSLGQPAHLRLVLNRALSTSSTPAEKADLLRALLAAQRRRNTRPEGDLSATTSLLKAPSDVAILAAECVGRWKLVEALNPLQEIAVATQGPSEVRQAAITALSELGTQAGWQVLESIAKNDPSEVISQQAIVALAPVHPQQASTLAVGWLGQSKSAPLQVQLVQSFLQKQGAADLLAKALAGKKLPEDAAKMGLRAVTGSGRQEPALTDALTKAGGMSAEPKVLTPEQTAQLLKEVKEQGNAAIGQAIFHRSDLSCVKCHAIGGAGGKVGPDLLSIGASAQPDYLLDSLLQPNKNVKEGYQTAIVLTDEGKVFTGVKIRQSDEAVILRDADDKEVAVPLSSIEEERPGSSLMPAGLTDKLTREELIHLTRFLTELGKPGPFAIDPARPVARQWEALLPAEESYRRLTRTSDAQLMANDAGLSWTPAYTYVDGSLMLDHLPAFGKRDVASGRFVSFVRTYVDVPQAGEYQVKWNDVSALQGWLDGQPVELHTSQTLRLPAGRHVLSIAIDRRARQQPVQIEGISPALTFRPVRP